MKKLYLIILLLMAFAMTATAQNKKMKIAVMDFKAGVGVNVNEVEGLSDMLINTLYESGKFSIVERSQIEQVLKEWRFQASELTNEQLAQVGRILGVESVLIGTVNFLAEHRNHDGSVTGEYNVDVRAVDVESGEVVTTAGATKSSGSTYRAMMERIGRQLAANLVGYVDPIEVRTGLLTKSDIKDLFGNYIYYLDGQRLTNKEYLEIINNCPESKYYYEKGCRQRKTGRILAIWVPAGCIVTGTVLGVLSADPDVPWIGVVWGAMGGAASALASIPFFVSGRHKKENAYQVYNEYCAKPAASLSFGPATNGVGMGVYLNF